MEMVIITFATFVPIMILAFLVLQMYINEE